MSLQIFSLAVQGIKADITTTVPHLTLDFISIAREGILREGLECYWQTGDHGFLKTVPGNAPPTSTTLREPVAYISLCDSVYSAVGQIRTPLKDQTVGRMDGDGGLLCGLSYWGWGDTFTEEEEEEGWGGDKKEWENRERRSARKEKVRELRWWLCEGRGKTERDEDEGNLKWNAKISTTTATSTTLDTWEGWGWRIRLRED